MKKFLLPAALLAVAFACGAHAEVPKGWFLTGSAPADYDVGTEAGTRHPGDRNAFIRAKSSLPTPEKKDEQSGFGSLAQAIDAGAYRGQRVRVSGFLRTRDATRADMWLRIDGSSERVLAFANTSARELSGTRDWQRCDLVVDVPEEARHVIFGFLLSGKGEVWADDFRLEKVSKDVPLTGMIQRYPSEPVNLDFSQ
jgi:hypothetical protein